ncbi:polymorphic toxin-type HINT domain-containing protein [Murinocardiopsis flavida]|uniref:polymorphic toxin-type HINT domain-containing protein n=1 Tax=Murinocardiopsis flavida TaxID=645275 RepID=UPI000D0D0337|nr:polymorphic toxin-type HINT domain-containing protein [Murinocardiopsis flavida]
MWRAESGAGKIEYAALVVLAAAIVSALLYAGLPTDVRPAVSSAACELFGGDDCEPGEGGGPGADPAASGDPAGSGDPGASGEPSAAPSPGSSGAPDGQGGPDVEPADSIDQEVEDAEQEYADALADQEDADSEYGNLDEELLALLEDLIGLTDAKKCFLEGDIQACLWTALNAIPWSKALKVASKIPKAYKLFEKWRKGSKAADKAKERVREQKRKLDELKRKQEERLQERRRRAGCKSSFLPGTPVLMADGTERAIEDVAAGDTVLAFDPRTGEEGPRPVTRTFGRAGAQTLVEIAVVRADGTRDTVTATGSHPFWDPAAAAWVDAADLAAGDTLRTSSGAWAEVASVRTRSAADQQVHNFTVDGLNTYYIGAADEAVLVQNCDEWTGQGNLDDHYSKHGEKMRYESQIEYKEAAKDLMCDCDGGRPGVIAKVDRAGGAVRYFDPETGEYGMKSSKGIITFYKLDGGQSTFDAMPGGPWKEGDPLP